MIGGRLKSFIKSRSSIQELVTNTARKQFSDTIIYANFTNSPSVYLSCDVGFSYFSKALNHRRFFFNTCVPVIRLQLIPPLRPLGSYWNELRWNHQSLNVAQRIKNSPVFWLFLVAQLNSELHLKLIEAISSSFVFKAFNCLDIEIHCAAITFVQHSTNHYYKTWKL